MSGGPGRPWGHPWAVARRPWIVAAGLGLYAVLLLLVRESVLRVPSLTVFGSPGVKAMNFLPLIVCVCLLHCLERRLPPAEATAVRGVGNADRLLVATTLGTVVLIGTVFHLTFAMPSATACARNTIVLTGIALAARAWRGAALAAVVTVGWLLLTLACGLRTPADPYPWAVLLEPAGRPEAALAALLALAAGLYAVGHQPGRGRTLR
ncbi:hypothetical protein EES47_12005 [Streptomyces sp. ADI98-12]|uniref:Uncharacterized protein n=1 Tax=Streptomyces griseus TaxID=1911 RepID=A0A380MM25_STRGR|nr:hypothetical protein EES47_12005 [Streptomyces sp. ADI98-12]GGU19220.1 hypothetical protein GCM10015534_22510 [Streptomyces diastaticus subsp. diastaticus]SUO93679.1 Uncharacterised protein [Streptomyces griseus]